MSLPFMLHSQIQRQHGFITRAQATEYGCTRRELERWIGGGQLRNLWRGILCILAEPDNPGDRNLQLARGISIAYDDRVVLSHQSALLAHGLPTYGADLSQVTLVRGNGGDSLNSGRVRISRSSSALPHSEIHGARVVDPAIAIAQVACETGIEAAVVAADAAVHDALITPADVEAAVAMLGRCRGLPRARQVAGLIDGRSESPGETLTRLIAQAAGIELQPQVEIRDHRGGFVARVDFLIAGTRRVVEFDGKVKYASAEDLYAEKRREDRLRELGYQIVRVVWSDLSHPARLVARLQRAYGQQAG